MEDYNNPNEGVNQTQDISSTPEQKSNIKIWLLIFIPVFVILIGVIIFLFMSSSSKIISENEFAQGINLQFEETKEAKFIIDDEEHTIKVNSVSGDSVNLIIQSNPIQVDLKIGETKKFDLNGDGFYDIQVKLNGIENGVPEIYIKKIHEGILNEDNNNTPQDNPSINNNTPQDNPSINNNTPQDNPSINNNTPQDNPSINNNTDDNLENNETSENPCYPYICSNIQECIDGICVTKTCSELGGVLCPSPENNCSGELWGLDEGSCCIGTCTPQNSCDSLEGIFCKKTLCEGDSIETYDSPSNNVCCMGTCHTGECGETTAQTTAQQYIDSLANNDYGAFVSLINYDCSAVRDECKIYNCPEDDNTYESTCQNQFESDRSKVLAYSSIDFYRVTESEGYSHAFFHPILNGQQGSVTIECQKNYQLGGCRVVARAWYT